MIRRQFGAAIGAYIVSGSTRAWVQQGEKLPVIGVLITHVSVSDPFVEYVRSGFRALGYEEGRNIGLEFVSAEGRHDRLDALARQLVAEKVDAIISPNELSARAAQKATRDIPIVMFVWTDEPIALGLIASFARPGANITGIYSLHGDLDAKRVELIKEALPGLKSFALFWDPSFGKPRDEVERAAQGLALRMSIIEVRSGAELESGFRIARQKKAGAALFMQSPLFYLHRQRSGALSREFGIPAVGGQGEHVRAGFLMTYGVDVRDIARRSAYYVDRLLKEARPESLPLEQVSQLRLVLNQRVARRLGLRIPDALALRADEVLQ